MYDLDHDDRWVETRDRLQAENQDLREQVGRLQEALRRVEKLPGRWAEEAERGRLWEASQRKDGDEHLALLNQQRAGVREACVSELRAALGSQPSPPSATAAAG